jgi:hypothetical protein
LQPEQEEGGGLWSRLGEKSDEREELVEEEVLERCCRLREAVAVDANSAGVGEAWCETQARALRQRGLR